MQQVEVIREIDAPIDVVWAQYTDHISWSDWAGVGKVALAHSGSPMMNGVGCVRVISSFGVRVYEEVLSFEPPRRMTYRVVKGGLPMRDHHGEVDFAANGESTTIAWRCRFAPRIPGTGAPMKWLITTVFGRALDGLSRAVK